MVQVWECADCGVILETMSQGMCGHTCLYCGSKNFGPTAVRKGSYSVRPSDRVALACGSRVAHRVVRKSARKNVSESDTEMEGG